MNTFGQVLLVAAVFFAITAAGYYQWARAELSRRAMDTATKTRDSAFGFLTIAALLVVAIAIWGS